MEALTNWQRSALDLFGFDGLVDVTPKFMVYDRGPLKNTHSS